MTHIQAFLCNRCEDYFYTPDYTFDEYTVRVDVLGPTDVHNAIVPSSFAKSHLCPTCVIKVVDKGSGGYEVYSKPRREIDDE